MKRHKISALPGNPQEPGEPLAPFTFHLCRVGGLGLVLLGGPGIAAVLLRYLADP